MIWTVTISAKVRKGLIKLQSPPAKPGVTNGGQEAGGPVRGDWPNYGKLAKHRHHCHIRKGRPTYVAVWKSLPTASD